MKIFKALCLAFFLFFILVGVFNYFRDRAVQSDATSQAALQQEIVRAKPMTDALGAYYAANHYYPKSINEVPGWKMAWGEFNYIPSTESFHSIFKSPACQDESKTFDRFHSVDDDFRKRFATFTDRCVQGYSEYVLRSPPLPQEGRAESYDQTDVYGKYTSPNGQWALAWCHHGNNRGRVSNSGDCPLHGLPAPLDSGAKQFGMHSGINHSPKTQNVTPTPQPAAE